VIDSLSVSSFFLSRQTAVQSCASLFGRLTLFSTLFTLTNINMAEEYITEKDCTFTKVIGRRANVDEAGGGKVFSDRGTLKLDHQRGKGFSFHITAGKQANGNPLRIPFSKIHRVEWAKLKSSATSILKGSFTIFLTSSIDPDPRRGIEKFIFKLSLNDYYKIKQKLKAIELLEDVEAAFCENVENVRNTA
jgi:hypothetical protein